MRPFTKKKVGLLTLATVLISSTLAYGYWTAGGSGTGSASTRSTYQNVTAVQTSAPVNMQPGDSPQTLAGNFNNPNSGPAYVTSVTASITSVTTAQGAPAGTCNATDYTLANATMTVNAEVAAGSGVGSWTGATIKFNNKATNQDACKGATVTLSYAVS